MRRNFLGSVAASLGLGFLVKEKPIISEFGLGEYQSHYAEIFGMRYDVSKHYDCKLSEKFLTFVEFPIENKLTIIYEKGEENYISFNCPKETIAKINTISGADLFRTRKLLTQEEAESIMLKYDTLPFKFDGKLFKLASVLWTKEYYAYTIPNCGTLPKSNVIGA